MVKHGSLGIPEPQLSEERAHNTYKVASEFLVGLILGGTGINYVAHKVCVRRTSADAETDGVFGD